MPRTKPGREDQRKDVWLTERDMENILELGREMERQGINPYHRGRFSVSKVIRWALENQRLNIGGLTK